MQCEQSLAGRFLFFLSPSNNFLLPCVVLKVRKFRIAIALYVAPQPLTRCCGTRRKGADSVFRAHGSDFTDVKSYTEKMDGHAGASGRRDQGMEMVLAFTASYRRLMASYVA